MNSNKENKSMEDAIKEMGAKIGLPDNVIANALAPSSDLEDFSVGDVVTFGEFINAPAGTEFIFEARKYGNFRCACQCVPTDVKFESGKDREGNDCVFISWSDSDGDPQIRRQDDNVPINNVGNRLKNEENKWTYSVYHVKK